MNILDCFELWAGPHAQSGIRAKKTTQSISLMQNKKSKLFFGGDHIRDVMLFIFWSIRW